MGLEQYFALLKTDLISFAFIFRAKLLEQCNANFLNLSLRPLQVISIHYKSRIATNEDFEKQLTKH